MQEGVIMIINARNSKKNARAWVIRDVGGENIVGVSHLRRLGGVHDVSYNIISDQSHSLRSRLTASSGLP